MTLDETIKHAEDVAEEKNKLAERIRNNMKSEIALNNATECEICADEHRQLAEWLKDYKRLLEQDTVSREAYTSEYFARKEAEQKLWELQQNVSEDCVSRADARHFITESFRKNLLGMTFDKMFKTLYKGINDLSPVIPIISKNATNGDMILTMFDTATVYGIDKENDCIIICLDNNFYQKFRYSWWNAQYTEKRGDENE